MHNKRARAQHAQARAITFFVLLPPALPPGHGMQKIKSRNRTLSVVFVATLLALVACTQLGQSSSSSDDGVSTLSEDVQGSGSSCTITTPNGCSCTGTDCDKSGGTAVCFVSGGNCKITCTDGGSGACSCTSTGSGCAGSGSGSGSGK